HGPLRAPSMGMAVSGSHASIDKCAYRRVWPNYHIDELRIGGGRLGDADTQPERRCGCSSKRQPGAWTAGGPPTAPALAAGVSSGGSPPTLLPPPVACLPPRHRPLRQRLLPQPRQRRLLRRNQRWRDQRRPPVTAQMMLALMPARLLVEQPHQPAGNVLCVKPAGGGCPRKPGKGP